MILLLRAVTRLVTFVLLAALAACGLAIAIFSIGWSRTGDFNLPGLARLVHLGDLRDQVGELLIGTSPLVLLGRIMLVLVALALVWYGAMLMLLAFKVSPHTVNQLSGYRSAYNYLAGLKPRDITSDTRLIAGLAGLAGFLVFGYLALKEIPRPHLTRSDLRLLDDERGVVDVAPRAIERAVESAALEREAVQEAAARYAATS